MQYLEYMAAAYAIIWAAILVYFLILGRREQRLWEEIRSLRAQLTSGEIAPRPGQN
jgi:CcmD family protein